MADNTWQFRWIVTIQGGLDALFKDDPNVFVAGDLLWYPVEGRPDVRVAPDVMIAFGRPKGDRGSYQQWREGGVAPQVVFEVLSPGNTLVEMLGKLRFYERYRVEEFYIYDPDRGDLSGWIGADAELTTIESMQGWVSPRLGVRFELASGELQIYRPDGRPFETYVDLERSRRIAEQDAEQERQRAERLAAQLRALGIAPEEESG
ncbi:MAG TPA: Uma2 family endonuclease [Roseiflexaceae bacterium]